MTTELGHEPNRVYIDHNGDFHLNGAEFFNDAETGLADTLKRMRDNLDACRRTRIEVETAQRMEEEIRGVFEAGHEMFVAAVHAIRERAEALLA